MTTVTIPLEDAQAIYNCLYDMLENIWNSATECPGCGSMGNYRHSPAQEPHVSGCPYADVIHPLAVLRAELERKGAQ